MTGSGSTGALEHWSPIQASSCGRYDARSTFFLHWLRSVSMHRGREAPRHAVAGGVEGGTEAGTLFPRTDVTWICIFDAGKLKPKYLFKKLFIL